MNANPDSIELFIEPRSAVLTETMTVRRVLPFRSHRMVGPFCFLDHMGPHEVLPNENADVLAHPHIGLSTVTYLFEGHILHRDSLGSVQEIHPGDVNWMTAGQGIVHSEKTPEEWRTKTHQMHGLQAWVALPLDNEQIAPSFQHQGAESLPHFALAGVSFRLIAGSFLGRTSPVRTFSKLFYVEARMEKGSRIDWNADRQEAAFYLIDGEVAVDNKIFSNGGLIVFKVGAKIQIEAKTKVHGMLLGGEGFREPRYIYWNFVSSSKDQVELAKERWQKQEFPKINGEADFIPLPSL